MFCYYGNKFSKIAWNIMKLVWRNLIAQSSVGCWSHLTFASNPQVGGWLLEHPQSSFIFWTRQRAVAWPLHSRGHSLSSLGPNGGPPRDPAVSVGELTWQFAGPPGALVAFFSGPVRGRELDSVAPAEAPAPPRKYWSLLLLLRGVV